MNAIYFADPGGDIEEERDTILKALKNAGITGLKIEATDEPPWDRSFDILFFDWGGMSLGNSMLNHFCRWIMESAEDNPGRIYVMVSEFTKDAMSDALNEMPENRPGNIFLSLEDAVPTFKACGL